VDRILAFLAGTVFGGAVMELLSPVPVRRAAGGRDADILVAGAPDYSTVHLLARIQQLISEIKNLTRHAEAKSKPAEAPPAEPARPREWRPVPAPGGKLASYSWAARGLIFICGSAAVGLGTRKGGAAGSALAAGGILLIAAESAREAAWKWPGGAPTSPEGALRGAERAGARQAGAKAGL
jgi:hypothetical protein